MSIILASRMINFRELSSVSTRRVAPNVIWQVADSIAKRGVEKFGGEIIKKLPNGDSHLRIGGNYPEQYFIARPMIHLPNNGKNLPWLDKCVDRATDPNNKLSWCPYEVVWLNGRGDKNYYVRNVSLFSGNEKDEKGNIAFDARQAYDLCQRLNDENDWT